MTETARQLTETEMKGLDVEYRLLGQKLDAQTREQVAFLRLHIADDLALSDEQCNSLIKILEEGGFKLKLFRVSDANVQAKQTIQVTYELHDDLHAYLTQPRAKLPRALRGFLDGGSTLDPKLNKDTAQDPTPLTGKTRTGIKKYDDIIDSMTKKGT